MIYYFFQIRKRPKGKKTNIKLKDFDRSVIRASVMHALDMNHPTPHALIELSQREHQRLRNNCIHLSNVDQIDNGPQVTYSKICYGSNIKKKLSPFNQMVINSNQVNSSCQKLKKSCIHHH